jgi:hypothetical protein
MPAMPFKKKARNATMGRDRISVNEFNLVACSQSRLFTTKHTKMHEDNQKKLINPCFVPFVVVRQEFQR